MAYRNVVKNDMDFLTKKSREVTVFDAKLDQLVEDMKETLERENGVGLAAPQVGILRRLFIVDFGNDQAHDYREFINPVILKTRGKNTDYQEGCLSFPGRLFVVERPNYVKIKAQNKKGEPFEMALDDFMARAVMHENDHLNGIVIPMIGQEQEQE